MLPLPAIAFAVSNVLTHADAFPAILTVGLFITEKVNEVEVVEQPLEFVTITV